MVSLLVLFLLQVPVTPPLSVSPKGLAVKGFDLVAYFAEGDAVKGSNVHKAEHSGAIYYFSSAANLEEFEKAPDRYLPLFGGYCAFGMTRGRLVEADPRWFQIYEDKLMLQHSDWTKTLFNLKIRSNWRNANEKWQELVTVTTSQ